MLQSLHVVLMVHRMLIRAYIFVPSVFVLFFLNKEWDVSCFNVVLITNVSLESCLFVYMDKCIILEQFIYICVYTFWKNIILCVRRHEV